jgi:hypothetical protein
MKEEKSLTSECVCIFNYKQDYVERDLAQAVLQHPVNTSPIHGLAAILI